VQLRHLNYFLEVLETKSLSKASKKLNVTQPALTKAIRRLEEELGVPLFVRGSRGMIGTEFAESLRGFAQASGDGYKRSLQELKAIRGGKTGTVTIAAPPLLVATMLPRALVAFHKASPDVRVLVKIAIAELFDFLADGECDLVLAMQPKPEKRFPGFEENVFTDDRMMVVARPNHPIAKVARPQVKHVAQYSWVLPTSGTILRDRLEAIFEEAGASPPRCTMECLAPDLIKQVVLSTDLLGWVPQTSCQSEIANGSLHGIRLPSRLISRKIGVFWNSYHFTPAAQRLRNAILKTAA